MSRCGCATFSYLATIVCTVFGARLPVIVLRPKAAVPVAVAGLRHWDGRGVKLIRRVQSVRQVQSGSVNDYAAYLVVGLLVSVAAVVSGGAVH